MCTVTYIPPSSENGFILTSNRDEKDFRPTVPPKIYNIGDKQIAFPKDEKAGGSWIAVNKTGKTCCLLNGGFIAHQKQAFHTLSRGTILLELTASDLSVTDYFASKNLANVEPFTIVSIELNETNLKQLSEFIWDGNKTHYRQLDINSPYIWSSATLYTQEHRSMRKGWFEQFFNASKDAISPEKIYTFHSGSHTDDTSINLVMQREGGLKTVSITQVIGCKNKRKLIYTDLLNNKNYALEV